MTTIYRRSLGHLARRKPTEVVDIKTAPADELSSWLSDDVCTNCGCPAAHGKLFCSEECKLADANQIAQVSKLGYPEELKEELASPTVRCQPFSKDDVLLNEKFRYPCPPSPSILAQYHTPINATSLTSPALLAYQSSLPSSRDRLGRTSQTSIDAYRLSLHKKRSSSQSTFSSISESNTSLSAFASTEPSTPSPAYGATEDDSSDLDANEIQLPPSISTASTVVFRNTFSKPSSHAVDVASSSAIRRTSEAGQKNSPMWYVRRPSATNLPPTVLYASPSLADTTTTKVNATVRSLGTSVVKQLSTLSLCPQDSQATATSKSAIDLVAKIAARANQSSPKSPNEPKSSRNSFSIPRVYSEQLSGNTRSPPQLQSACSSAGKTFKASSPLSSRALSPMGTNAGCDRCRTLSNMSSDRDIYATSTHSPSARHVSIESNLNPRAVFRYMHKHSHSAAAGLFFTRLNRRAPVLPVSISPTEKVTLQSDHPSPASFSQQKAVRATLERGRSEARGRSSHRRNPSPPRAVARRPSLFCSSSSPLLLSPRSNPISISTKARGPSDQDIYHHDQQLGSALPERPSPLKLMSQRQAALNSPDKERNKENQPIVETRGRSRGHVSNKHERSMSNRRRIHSDCQVSWNAYDQPTKQGRPLPASPKSDYPDPGFNDVDLELDDGDDECSSSEEASFEPSSPCGRTLCRA